MFPGPKTAATAAQLLARIAVAGGAILGSLAAAQPALAQSGRIEKPNITFGVFPSTNYGVVYLSIQQGFFQAEGLNVMPRLMGARYGTFPDKKTSNNVSNVSSNMVRC